MSEVYNRFFRAKASPSFFSKYAFTLIAKSFESLGSLGSSFM